MSLNKDDLEELARQFEEKGLQFLEAAEKVRSLADLSNTPALPEPEEVKEQQPLPLPLPKHISYMEKCVMEILEGQDKGLHINKIADICKDRFDMGTINSVRVSCSKLIEKGYVVRLCRGRYATVESQTEPC